MNIVTVYEYFGRDGALYIAWSTYRAGRCVREWGP